MFKPLSYHGCPLWDLTGQHFLFLFAFINLQCKISPSPLLCSFLSKFTCPQLPHHSDTDESPIFTCIFHFPCVAGYLTSLPASQIHNSDVKVSLLKIELLIFSSNFHLLAITADNTTLFLNSLDFKFHGPFNSFLHHLITAQAIIKSYQYFSVSPIPTLSFPPLPLKPLSETLHYLHQLQ